MIKRVFIHIQLWNISSTIEPPMNHLCHSQSLWIYPPIGLSHIFLYLTSLGIFSVYCFAEFSWPDCDGLNFLLWINRLFCEKFGPVTYDFGSTTSPNGHLPANWQLSWPFELAQFVIPWAMVTADLKKKQQNCFQHPPPDGATDKTLKNSQIIMIQSFYNPMMDERHFMDICTNNMMHFNNLATTYRTRFMMNHE